MRVSMPPVPSQRWASVPRLVRFLIVGGLNTVFGYAAYAALLYVGLHYASAVFFATVAGVCFNFFTTGTLVFDGLSGPRLLRFVLVYVVVYGLNVALLAVLTRLGLDPYVAGAVCILPMAVVSYLLMRTVVFTEAPCR